MCSKCARKLSTYPRSLSDLSWVLVSRRGSPLPSAATASSSSNGGMMNKSRRLFFDFRLVPTFDAFTEPVVNAFIVDDDVVDEIGWGKSVRWWWWWWWNETLIIGFNEANLIESSTTYWLEKSSSGTKTATRHPWCARWAAPPRAGLRQGWFETWLAPFRGREDCLDATSSGTDGVGSPAGFGQDLRQPTPNPSLT